jgi:hypothetical protein
MTRRLVVDDGGHARELLLVGTMTVGRDPDCEISHRDPRLSRRHAEFTVRDDGVVVRDLDSRNGIRVNGGPVKEAVLQPGDTVQIAQLTVRYVDEHALARALTTGSGAAVSSAIAVAAAVEDDRTRVAVGPGASRRSAPPAARDLAEVVFRDVPAAAVDDQRPPQGIQSLIAVGWGRRVLLQGLMLALVVFLMSTVPLILWQLQAFGVSAAQSLVVLMPPLLAAGAAGVLVASLIARTTARGLQRHGRTSTR